MILLGFALVSHTFAGGSFTNIARLFAMLMLIVCALFILGRSVLSGPRLALLVLIVQSSTHFVLGGINSGGIVMSASHIIGGFTSFILLTKFAMRQSVGVQLLLHQVMAYEPRHQFLKLESSPDMEHVHENFFQHHLSHILLSAAALVAIGIWWYFANRSRK
jgi:hypothetical protein